MARKALVVNSITVDSIEVRRQLDSMGKGAKRSIVAAINRTAAQAKKDSVDLIYKSITLQKSYINRPDIMQVRKATTYTPSAQIIAKGRGILLSRFQNRIIKGAKRKGVKSRRGAGIRVRVLRGSSGRLVPRAFKIKLKNSGAVGIAIRTGPGRTQLKVLHGLAPYQLAKASTFNQVRITASEHLQRELEAAMVRLAAK